MRNRIEMSEMTGLVTTAHRVDNRAAELPGGTLLREIVRGARLLHPLHHVGRIVHGERDNPDFGELFLNALGGRDAVTPRHVDIHHHDVRLEHASVVDGLQTISRLTDDFQPGMTVHNGSQALPQHEMIIHQQHSNQGRLQEHVSLRYERRPQFSHSQAAICSFGIRSWFIG